MFRQRDHGVKHKTLRKYGAVEKQNWIFSWPRHMVKDECDVKLMNADLSYCGNGHIYMQRKAIVLYISQNCNSVHVTLHDIPLKSIKRVIIRKANQTFCYATNSGLQVYPG